jgi:hypothetical protein
VRKVVQGHRGVARAGAAAVRQAAVLHLVQEAHPKLRIGKRQGRWPCSRPAWSSTRSPRSGKDLVKVYERNGIECSLTDTRSAAVRRGCTAATSTSSPRWPRRTSRRWRPRSARQRHRGAPAHVWLRAEEGLPRLRGRARRRARGRAHLRRRRVPDEGAQGRRTPSSTPTSPATCRRPSPTTRRVTCGPRTSASRAAT